MNIALHSHDTPLSVYLSHLLIAVGAVKHILEQKASHKRRQHTSGLNALYIWLTTPAALLGLCVNFVLF